jgi:membrane-associated HD superfamily phosphohydrolase
MKKIQLFISNPPGYLEEMKNQPVKTDILTFLVVILCGTLCYLTAYIIQKGYIEQVQTFDPLSVGVLILSGISLFVVDGLFFLLIISLIEHFFVLFTERKPDYEKTLKSVIYALFIPILFLWVTGVFHIPGSIPALIAIFAVFTFYGTRAFHHLSNDRAAFVSMFTTGVIVILLYFGHVNLIG